MSEKIIYRILDTHFGLRIDDQSIKDRIKFDENFGNAIQLEIISNIYDSLLNSLKIKTKDSNSSEYKISIRVEKCDRFDVIKGETIG